MQQGMLFHSLMAPASGVYVEQLSATLHGDLNLDAFSRAWQQLLDRHTILRTAFVWEDLDEPLQVVYRKLEILLHSEDWRDLTPEEQAVRFDAYQQEQRKQGFDMADAPLMRVALIRVAADEYRFVWTFHHILLDGWSFPIILQELFTLYEAGVRGFPARLPFSRPYGDYIAWIQNQDKNKAAVYWGDLLTGFTSPTPLVVDRKIAAPTAAATYEIQDMALSAEDTEALRTLVRQNQLTLNTVVQGAWALLLSRYSGEQDVVFGATVSGRPHELPGSEKMVGLFINTLPARILVEPEASLLPWLQRIQTQQVQTRQFEYSALVDVQSWSDVQRDVSLFDSILVFENYPVSDALAEQRGSLEIRDVQSSEQTNYPLTVVAAPGRVLGIRIAFDQQRFEPTTITRMLEHLQTLLKAIIAQPDRRISSLPLLTEAERQQILVEWNRTERTIPAGTNVPGLFEERVALTPDAEALIFQEQTLSYDELNRRSNQLCHYLQAQGVGRGKMVGIYVGKSVEMIVALLGVLKSGAAYVPIDPRYPHERIQFMLEDAGIDTLLTQERLVEVRDRRAEDAPRNTQHAPRPILQIWEGNTIDLDSDWPQIALQPDHNPAIELDPAAPAYVIYTSGSTGIPKGVLIPHSALANHALALAEEAELNVTDRVLQFISLSFDASAEEIYPTLMRGGAIVVPDSALDVLGADLARFCSEREVTVLHMPASVWHVLVDDLDKASIRFDAPLRLLMLGGDTPSIEKLQTFSRLLGGPIPFLNLYGPTEATITATLYKTTTQPRDFERLPIGKPIANVHTYILDPAMRPAPIGAPGELYIGGAGLALGYLDRAEITAASFVTHTFGAGPTVRLYKTGDAARYLPDGNIEFLGRVDEQIKIRGYRVEPGEIEATLSQYEGVQDVAVIVQVDEKGRKRLEAYLAAAADLSQADLREYLGARLPSYMIPSAFVLLNALPRTPSGKLDRRALSEMDGIRLERGGVYEAPRGPEEEMLVGIWTQVLGRERIGIHDDFFDLGGHSLLATQLVSRVREAFQIDLSLSTLFETKTVAALAALIKQAKEDELGLLAPAIEPISRTQSLPLSFSQQRLWFLDQLEPGNLFYNMPIAVRLRGPLDVSALRQSMDEIIRRHEVLRTTYLSVAGRPRQIVHPELRLEFPLLDVSHLGRDEAETEAHRQASALVRQPFDLTEGPMLRAQLIRLDAEEHIAVLAMHHIVADAWSIGVFIGELALLYNAFSRGEPSPLPDLPIQYADYAYWQRNWLQGEALDVQLAYWKQQLAGAPALLDLPTDRPRPAIQTANGTTYSFTLPAVLADSLHDLSREEGATLFMALLAGFQLLLSRYSGQNDICVGSAIANRTRGETERLIGFFVNTLVLRSDLSGNPTFRALLDQVRDTALAAYAHQDVPFELLVDALQPERDLSHAPLFQVGFALQNIPLAAQELPDLMIEPIGLESNSAKYDITLTLSEGAGGLAGSAEYNTDLFDAGTVERMMAHYQRLLESAVADPDRSVFVLPMLTLAEQQQMLVEWNDTAVAYPAHQTIHQLFEEQVTRSPHAPAVIFAEDTLTYGQLNRRANQLAHHLLSLGVGPETVVAISMNRSLDMAVGILGILKAGAAYLPIAPTYPAERITYMLQDSQTPVLLTQAQVLALLPAQVTQHASRLTISLDAEWPEIAKRPDTNPDGGAGTDNLAYVIYTSGSTGLPKGTMLSHRGLCNLADVHHRAFDMREGKRVLQFAPFSFDASVWEMVMALRNGAALVYAPQETLASGPDMLALLKEQVITTVTLPPSLLAVLQPEVLPDLDTVIAAGEPCSGEIVAQWSPGRRFFNAYGPTETTVCAAMFLCDPSASYPQGPPIGGPIANFELYVVDANLQPVPLGAPGELLVGGVGLARGYLGRPALTAERFIPNPFTSPPDGVEVATGGRLYRTGDLVRFLPGGDVEFLERLDHQVKVRGFRIELGEIEARLRQHPAIKENIVIARGGDHRPSPKTDKRLVAYITPKDGASIDVGEIKAFLREILPEYMIPTAFVELEALPLTPSAKIDRKALPAPETTRARLEQAYTPPNTETEKQLVEIYAELLHIDQVGIHDNFFALGGHSLLATQLISRLRDVYGVELPLRSLFEHPTVAELSMEIDVAKARGAERTTPTIKRVARSSRRVKRSRLTPHRADHSGPPSPQSSTEKASTNR